MREMRSSVIFLGAILGRCGNAIISSPGGCELGPRPIDLHIKSFEKLGVNVKEEFGYIKCEADEIIGNDIHLDFPSVGATENIMLASMRAKGETVIQRTKNSFVDYRFVVEPDIKPFSVSEECIQSAQNKVGELPEQKRQRLKAQFGLSDFDVETLKSILEVDASLWIEETKGIEEFYAKFGDKIPATLVNELETLKAALK